MAKPQDLLTRIGQYRFLEEIGVPTPKTGLACDYKTPREMFLDTGFKEFVIKKDNKLAPSGTEYVDLGFNSKIWMYFNWGKCKKGKIIQDFVNPLHRVHFVAKTVVFMGGGIVSFDIYHKKNRFDPIITGHLGKSINPFDKSREFSDYEKCLFVQGGIDIKTKRPCDCLENMLIYTAKNYFDNFNRFGHYTDRIGIDLTFGIPTSCDTRIARHYILEINNNPRGYKDIKPKRIN